MSKSVLAEDCTGPLPGADCTLDEDTTAPLTIDGGIVLSIGSSVVINHEIDGDDNIGDGTIETFGGPNTITQNADIGRNTPINQLTIGDDNVWNTSAAINTDNNGSDIDLGAADGGETLNFLRGGSFSGEIDGNFGDTVTFGIDGNGGNFITGGQIESVIVIVGSGELTVNNSVGGGTSLGSLTVADGATLNMGANVTVGGPVDLDGTVRIGAGNALTGDTYISDADAATIVLELERETGTTTSGVLNIIAGGPLDLSNDSLEIALGPQSEVLIKETIASAIIGNTAASIGPNRFVDDSYLYNFNLVANGNDFDLVISVNSIEETTTSENNRQVANTILSNLANTDVTEFNRLQAALGNDSNREAFNERLESLLPTVDSGKVNASLVARDQLQSLTNQRSEQLLGSPQKPRKKRLLSGSKNLDSGRTRRANRNATPPEKEKGVLWAQGYAQSATQDRKDGLDGFDQRSGGVVFGADTGQMNRDMLLGMAVLAGTSTIDSNNSNATETVVDSYGLSFYGGKKISSKTLISGSVSYVHNTNEATRFNVGGFAGNNAQHENVTEHISIQSKLAHRYKTVKNLTITPSATLGYDYLYMDRYNENGAEQLSLSVNPDDINMLTAGAGVDLDWRYRTAKGMNINPKIYAHYKHALLNNKVQTSAVFLDGGNEFVTKGFDAQRSNLNLGGKISAEITEKWLVNAGYNFAYKDKYASHTGNVNAVYSFE